MECPKNVVARFIEPYELGNYKRILEYDRHHHF